MHELALFAGAGGGILGGKLLGWRTVCAVEWDSYAASVLVERQNDGSLPAFPVWDDVQTFDGKPWRGTIDIVSGGFPCQDISSAGKGAGIGGERSSMWKHMARIIGEVRPQKVLIENSPLLRTRGLGVVLEDLAAMGYDAKWGIVSAENAGAPHIRKRMWIIATDAHGEPARLNGRDEGEASREDPLSPIRVSEKGVAGHTHRDSESITTIDDETRGLPEFKSRPSRWEASPEIRGVDDGLANRMDRLKALGNGQAAPVVPLVWGLLGG